MMPLIVRTVFVLLVFAMASPVQSQQNQVAEQVSRLPWQSRPAVGAMGSVAKVSLSGDLRFLDSVSTRRFLELNGNPPRDNQYTLAPRSLDWFAIFVFDPSGYVRDDDRLDTRRTPEGLAPPKPGRDGRTSPSQVADFTPGWLGGSSSLRCANTTLGVGYTPDCRGRQRSSQLPSSNPRAVGRHEWNSGLRSP